MAEPPLDEDGHLVFDPTSPFFEGARPRRLGRSGWLAIDDPEPGDWHLVNDLDVTEPVTPGEICGDPRVAMTVTPAFWLGDTSLRTLAQVQVRLAEMHSWLARAADRGWELVAVGDEGLTLWNAAEAERLGLTPEMVE